MILESFSAWLKRTRGKSKKFHTHKHNNSNNKNNNHHKNTFTRRTILRLEMTSHITVVKIELLVPNDLFSGQSLIDGHAPVKKKNT